MKADLIWEFKHLTSGISDAYLARIILACAVVLVFYFLGRFLPKVIETALYKLPSTKDYSSMQGMLKVTIKALIWIVGISITLELLGLDGVFTKVIASAGIVGIIAGFALKDVSSNGFAGILIKAQHPFELGDWVQINNYTGEIKEIGTIMVGIETIEGQMAYIPNQNIYNAAFLNYSKFQKFRIIIEMGVSYGDDLEHVEEVALTTLRSLPMVEKPEDVDFYFMNVGGSTYNFHARYVVKYHDRIDMLKAQNEGIKALKKAFEKENIMVAYNVLTMDFGGKGGVNLDETSLKVIEAKNNVSNADNSVDVNNAENNGN